MALNTRLATKLAPSQTMASLSPTHKILLLLCNMIPLMQVCLCAAAIGLLHSYWYYCVVAVVAILYLAPPIVCRLLMMISPIRQNKIPIGSREFFIWWFGLNCQVLYCRFPAMEEILRVFPSLYSMWLRLWGSRIGKLTYWAAGLQVLDRQFLRVGDNVTFGAGVKLNPHVMAPDENGQIMLYLAPIEIGDRVSIGGYSLLVAGNIIAADHATRAFTILPPFCKIDEGKRVKPQDDVTENDVTTSGTSA